MSLYFDHPVQTAKNSGLIHSIIQWHPKHPILAVASYHETAGGELNFFFEEVAIAFRSKKVLIFELQFRVRKPQIKSFAKLAKKSAVWHGIQFIN